MPKTLFLFLLLMAPAAALLRGCDTCSGRLSTFWEVQLLFSGIQIALAVALPLVLGGLNLNPFRHTVQVLALVLAAWLGYTLHAVLGPSVWPASWFQTEHLPFFFLFLALPMMLLVPRAVAWDTERALLRAEEEPEL